MISIDYYLIFYIILIFIIKIFFDVILFGYKNGKLTFEAVQFDGNEYITSEYVFTFDHSNTSTSDYFDNEKEASERLKDKKSNLE